MSERTQGAADQFVDAVLTASRVLVAVSARSLAEVEDSVTVVQFRTLVVLRMRGSINLIGLAEALAVTSSTALRMVDRLVAAELVERNSSPTNRREVLVTLTGAGRRLVDRVTRSRRAEIARIAARMPVRRRDDLVSALEAFAEAAGEPPASAAPSSIGW